MIKTNKKTRDYVVTNEYADRIRTARINAGLTQQQLADALDVSYQAVSSWEQPTAYVPDTKHLIKLASTCGVSVSSLVEDKNHGVFKTTKNIYDTNKMIKKIKEVANNYTLINTSNALEFAIKKHKSQKRKNSDVPYIYHPLNMACHLIAMGIKDDTIIAASLLHDVVEDCEVTKDELPVDKETKELVALLTHQKEYDDRDKMLKKYYKGLSSNPKAALIKLVDRCNNITTMSWGLSRDRIYRVIHETDEYVLPLLNVIKEKVEYYNASYLLSYQIKTTLDIYKRLM